ncbi:MAG: prepilin peptidase [Armatimonadota bacterium]
MIDWAALLLAFVFGIVVGSFLNVCIWRLPREESLVEPGSHCPKCNTPLKAWDLVPLLSFLIQGCKCRYCKEPITWRYFFVELATGIYFILVYLKFGLGIDFVAYSLFGASLIAILFIDLEHFIIPDQLSIFGIVIGVARDIANISTGRVNPFNISIPGLNFSIPIPQSIAAILVCGGTFLLIAIISYYIYKKEGIGGGDVKLAAAIGANLLIGQATLSFFLAALIGGMIAIYLLINKKKTGQDYLAFGPMMVVGTFVAMFYGKEIIRWWLGLYGLS